MTSIINLKTKFVCTAQYEKDIKMKFSDEQIKNTIDNVYGHDQQRAHISLSGAIIRYTRLQWDIYPSAALISPVLLVLLIVLVVHFL